MLDTPGNQFTLGYAKLSKFTHIKCIEAIKRTV